MSEQMKQVSLRRFRDTIADLRAPVEVSRRDPEGNIQILGFWTPYMQDVPGSVELPVPVEDDDNESGFSIIKTPKEAAAAVPQVRPFTKADQAGRKKR